MSNKQTECCTLASATARVFVSYLVTNVRVAAVVSDEGHGRADSRMRGVQRAKHSGGTGSPSTEHSRDKVRYCSIYPGTYYSYKLPYVWPDMVLRM